MAEFGAPGDIPGNVLQMLSAHKVAVREYEIASGNINPVNPQAGGVDFPGVEALRGSIFTEDLAKFDEAYAKARSGESATAEYRIADAAGNPVWQEENFFPVGDQILSYILDAGITHRQADKIRELDDKYRKLVNTLPDFIFVFNRDFVFQDIIMPEGMSLLHSREELIGTSGSNIFTEEVSRLYLSNIGECLDTGQMREIEYYLLINDIRYYFQARIVPFEDNKVFALIHDIGDRVKRMNELLEARRRAEDADRMKSAFLANMSHEIRTPLNAIVGFAEVIAMEEDAAARMEYMDVVRTNSDLLLQLINDILDLSRIESGKCEMNFQNTNINNMLHEVEMTQQLKMKPGVEFKVEHPDKEVWAYTDHKRITQILFNFLSNAIKNTETGSITLKAQEEGNHLRFSVTDTGRGIPEDRLSTIFNRFEKINDFVQGTGLGLAISQTLAERLGGEIKAESVLGKGSTFSFTIPYRKDADHLWGEEVSCGPEGRKKILVAEDSESNFNFIKEVLSKTYDADILWAKDGEEAINSFVMEKPNLILMNIQLPVMTGIEATKKIRTMSSKVPIIGITANAFYMEQQWALESGCNDIISKPYSATKLEEVVLAFMS